MKRLCLSGSRICTGLVPCDSCRRVVRSMALAPALLRLGVINRDVVAVLIRTFGEEAEQAFRSQFPGGLLTSAMAEAALQEFNEGWLRCSSLVTNKPKTQTPPAESLQHQADEKEE